MIRHIVKRDGRVVPFDKKKIAFAIFRAAVAVGGRDKDRADYIADRVAEYLERIREPGDSSYPTVEEVQDAVEKMLIEEGHARTAKAYIVYRYEHALKRQGRESATYSQDNIPYQILWGTLGWAIDHDCYDTAGIRRWVEAGRLGELIEVSESFYRDQLQSLSVSLAERLEDLRVVIVAGPSSSGKTTTTRKIAELVEGSGRRLVPISVDDYFLDLETHPQDPRGDYDFETPQALDLGLFDLHLKELLAGKEVALPKYDFKHGRRIPDARSLRLDERDIVLIDSHHGLFEELTASVPEERKYRLYLETLAQVKDDDRRFIRWTDVRLLRRMVRDMQFRSYDPWQTLLHWYLVRRSELRYIISRLRTAESIINTFLPYELLILKPRLAERFPDFVAKLAEDPERRDAYERALRVDKLLKEIPDVDAEEMVPTDSILREFIGGSRYDVH
jgi:uridine kinase